MINIKHIFLIDNIESSSNPLKNGVWICGGWFSSLMVVDLFILSSKVVALVSS